MKTIKQIAEELGESKQRVYRYTVRNNICPSNQTGKTWFYDDETVQKIKAGIEKANQLMEEAHTDDVPQGTSKLYRETTGDSRLNQYDVHQAHSDVHQITPDESLRHDNDSHHDIDHELLQQLMRNFDVLNEQLEEKDRQLAEKDQQIHELHNRISEAHSLIDQQQQLQLHSMASNTKVIEGTTVEDVNEDNQSSDDSTEMKEDSKPNEDCSNPNQVVVDDHKQSFWRRLFGKK